MRGFIVLDHAPSPGGAWQFRWPSLTLSTVNRIHDLPGMRFDEAVDITAAEVQAADAVPRYFAAYEQAFDLPVYRPVTVTVVCGRGERFVVETDRGEVSARGIINATGTWETPYIPEYPGAERFQGRTLHTKDYRTASEFVGRHVVIVGAGIVGILIFAVVIALFYGLVGWIVTAVGCAIYNVVAGWIGGIEVEVDRVEPPAPPPAWMAPGSGSPAPPAAPPPSAPVP